MSYIQRDYSANLEELKTRVEKCDVSALDNIEFFFKEANTYTSGITTDVEKEVRWEINKFRRSCTCPTIRKKDGRLSRMIKELV